ncbi:hypothetical protein SUDANB132_00027 [Streptomyces sp. enrichment culture]
MFRVLLHALHKAKDASFGGDVGENLSPQFCGVLARVPLQGLCRSFILVNTRPKEARQVRDSITSHRLCPLAA